MSIARDLYIYFYDCTYNTDDGKIELDWYEVGRVVRNGTDFVYVGDLDIWPGEVQ